MTTTLDDIAGLLHAHGLALSISPDGRALCAPFQLPGGVLEVMVLVHPQGPVVELDIVFPFVVPAHRAGAVLEAVGLANMMLRLGRFDYDAAHRRLLYRAFHAVADAPVTAAQLLLLLRTGLLISEQLQLPFQDVCLRGGHPGLPVAELLEGARAFVQPEVQP